MKHLRELISKLLQKLSSLIIGPWSKKRSQADASLHSLEVQHEKEVQKKTQRHDAMNNEDLRADLEKQYGRTRWAKRLIDSILNMRKPKVY